MFRIDVSVMFALKMFVVFAPAERHPLLSAIVSDLRINVLFCVGNWVTLMLDLFWAKKKCLAGYIDDENFSWYVCYLQAVVPHTTFILGDK